MYVVSRRAIISGDRPERLSWDGMTCRRRAGRPRSVGLGCREVSKGPWYMVPLEQEKRKRCGHGSSSGFPGPSLATYSVHTKYSNT
jgi:hypothetical protein